ncbi:hypothetical protein LSTR_LSTR014062 [Laodelphax striatellus]|uniref:Uncharacterized protein n=1 Tax=Laodelphax striatellus TaxID=195883 RepID=A0A482XI28_LAOST|nr:hypothetical protein LSTR_LSTR014062 [Laodelphax striatellus]
MGKLKTQSSKTSPGKGRAKPKPKSTLKVKYRLKETLNHKLQKNEKSENMKKIITDEKSAVAHKKVDQQNPVREVRKFDRENTFVHKKVDLQQNPVRKEINHHKESASAHEKFDQQKHVKKEIQLHKEHHPALTKQEEFPKIASQVAARVENLQSIEKSLDKIAVKQDFNERGILPFDSSYIMKQLAKSRQSESILEIPGPRIMRVCSNIVNALPVIGTLTISSLMRSYNRLCLSYGAKKLVSNRMSKPLERLFNKHGDIVCLNIPLCGNVRLVVKPELIHEVYRQRDMSQITNSSFDSLNEVYNVLGKKNMRMDAISSVDDHMTCVIEHFDLKNLFWSANRYHDSLEKISDLLVQR